MYRLALSCSCSEDFSIGGMSGRFAEVELN
jgi:hypothetical protein